MLEGADRIVLADGIDVRAATLTDTVGRISWPLNPAGAFVLSRQGVPLEAISRDVADTYAVPRERAFADVLTFAWQLNRLGMANIVPASGRARRLGAWLVLALRLAPAGTVPPVAVRRRPLDTSSVRVAVASVGRALLVRALTIAFVTCLLLAHLGAITGAVSLPVCLVAGAAVGGALVAHESGHAIALRGLPSAIVMRARRVSVLHPPIGARRRALVAIAGPLPVALAGVTTLGVSALAGPGTELLAAAGGPAAMHALALTVLASDGRTACGLRS